ncbi:histone acetyltransferase subunit NuA4-domain-containing protein [Halteromyces radiatus]|uniref:histone acetyltransferase subunit NuA4-domain-containing protein n=1 Tax=Halteromyces radiatus TaxID=101107 RepID=UPI00221F77CE|nr:histone acetyltransferase subunit NuA4-domain-containing protein [Halteromyces radiatus]KAI8096846.1 histone acetyltransferase subunit NuA4-domain-containing protein [Halteromyces radiatus]
MPDVTSRKEGETSNAQQPSKSVTANEPPQVTRQKYDETKMELQALLNRKKQVDTNLINLEHSIYLFEGSYLEDTQQNGNIIRGFDGYLSSRPDKRKQKFTELDRLFSLSSSTYQKALAQKEDQDSSQDDRNSNTLSGRKDKKRKLKMTGGGDMIRKKKRAGSVLATDDDD